MFISTEKAYSVVQVSLFPNASCFSQASFEFEDGKRANGPDEFIKLIKAVQEQQEMIDSLKKIIEDQNKRFEKIESLLLKKE